MGMSEPFPCSKGTYQNKEGERIFAVGARALRALPGPIDWKKVVGALLFLMVVAVGAVMVNGLGCTVGGELGEGKLGREWARGWGGAGRGVTS